MANNRLYIICNGCEHCRLVAKSLGGWYCPSDYNGNEIAEFMNEHGQCSEWGHCTEPTAFSFKFERHPNPLMALYPVDEEPRP